MLTAQQSRRIDFLLKYLIPLLFGFLFDLPWLSQVGISASLVLATYFAGDFVDALLALWQALAVGAVVIIAIGTFFEGYVTAMTAPTIVVSVWICSLKFFRIRSKIHEKIPNHDQIVSFLLIGFIFLISPRSFNGNLAFIHHQDNARQLIAPLDLLRTGTFRLEFLNYFDQMTVSFFVKFLVICVSQLRPSFEVSNTLLALNSVSNTWIFVAGSFFIFMPRLFNNVLHLIKLKSHFLIWLAGLILTFWSYYITHLAGFLPLFILNTIVTVFLLSIWNSLFSNFFDVVWKIFVFISISIAMFGSWQPWFPVGLSATLVCLYRIVGRQRIVHFRRVIFLCTGILAVLLVFRLELLLSRIDLESFGPAFVPNELILLTSSVIALITLGCFKYFVVYALGRTTQKYCTEIPTLNLSIGFIALLIALLVFDDQNQVYFIAFVVLLLPFSNLRSITEFAENFRELSADERHDAPFMFLVVTFAYVLTIFFLSRYFGPNYTPQYAAYKSATAFYAQFFWVTVLPLFVLCSRYKFSFMYYSLILVSIVALFSADVGYQNEARSALWWKLDYRASVTEWWHDEFIDTKREDDSIVVICSNTSVHSNEYQTYVCNNFGHSESNDELSGVLRFQQFSMDGPSPYQIEDIKQTLKPTKGKKYVALFLGEPDDKIEEIFSDFHRNQFRFVVSDSVKG